AYIHISIHPSFPEIYFTSSIKTNTSISSPFLANLQTHLKGGNIIAITQPDFDRILYFTIKPFIRFGKIQDRILIVEFMGKHSNIVLVKENGMIESCIKLISSKINRFREIIPGTNYIPPPSQNKLNPLNIDESSFFNILNIANKEEVNLWQALQGVFIGLSSQSAKEIVLRADMLPEKKLADTSCIEFDQLWISFKKIISDIENYNLNPIVFKSPDTKHVKSYSIINSLQFSQYDKCCFKEANSCLAFYSMELAMERELFSLKNELSKAFNKNIDKMKSKVNDYKIKLDEIENCENYKLNGELIKANLSSIKRGVKEITLINYFSPNREYISIPLNDKLTPLQNAQIYFKKYRKIKNSYHTIFNFLKNSQAVYEKLHDLQSLYLQPGRSYSELMRIKHQLLKLGYIKKIKKKVKKKKKEISSPARYISKNGWNIFVGKNSKQNDLLTLKLASGNDVWLHVKNINGSHVIIKNKGMGQTPPLDTLIEAANLAVYFSKAKNENKVQVDYTLKKYVKKPKKAKPGMVIYSQEKCLFISLDLKIIKNILSRKLS
ncbi:MAG: NFACT RNA binding domain-containing protein, partial [Candidatus Caldatribacteriota bacterium]|nr:NFACT RNA binding domain-containing protein [Candidatus Caldatribacteriota bacterium]